VLAIARAGSLGSTAEALGVDATTIGRRLAALHDRVGYALFERSGTALLLTPAGRRLVADLEVMEEGALAVERKLAAAATPTGPVRIATTDAFASYFLVGELRALAADLPAIQIELVASTAIADLRRRDADIALRHARPQSPDLRGRRIARMPWGVYASADYLRRSPRVDLDRKLAGHAVIRWSGALVRPSLAAWLDAHASAAQVPVVSAALHVTVEACAAGIGLAPLPGLIAKGRGLVRAIDHAVDQSEIWVVVHRDLRKVPRVRAVADWLAARLAARVDRIEAI
jgi:DNA-binding transcriptional LysR family regulator